MTQNFNNQNNHLLENFSSKEFYQVLIDTVSKFKDQLRQSPYARAQHLRFKQLLGGKEVEEPEKNLSSLFDEFMW